MQRSAEPAALLAGGSRQLETRGTKSSAGGAAWEETGGAKRGTKIATQSRNGDTCLSLLLFSTHYYSDF